jgi:hypothetical protein
MFRYVEEVFDEDIFFFGNATQPNYLFASCPHEESQGKFGFAALATAAVPPKICSRSSVFLNTSCYMQTCPNLYCIMHPSTAMCVSDTDSTNNSVILPYITSQLHSAWPTNTRRAPSCPYSGACRCRLIRPPRRVSLKSSPTRLPRYIRIVDNHPHSLFSHAAARIS